MVSDFMVPCGLLLGAVCLGFIVCLYFVRHWYFAPLLKRIKRLEYMATTSRGTTEDIVPVTETTPRPRPPHPIRSRYVTVDHEPKPEYYR